MIQPSFAEFQKLAKHGNLIPVYKGFSADLLTPVSAYLRLAQGARYSFLLESVEGGEKIARYTFAGANPEEVFRYAAGGRVRPLALTSSLACFLIARLCLMLLSAGGLAARTPQCRSGVGNHARNLLVVGVGDQRAVSQLALGLRLL